MFFLSIICYRENKNFYFNKNCKILICAMISMELPSHTTQHGTLHLGVGVGVNPGDPAGSALAAIHSHHQENIGMQHHNHNGTTGGMHEETEKKRAFLLKNPGIKQIFI